MAEQSGPDEQEHAGRRAQRALALLRCVEDVALDDLTRQMARLRDARAGADEGQVARARMAMLDALELYSRAHWARLEAEHEEDGGGG